MKNLMKYILVLVMSIQLVNADEFIVDSSHSNVGFSIKHMMISNVKGNFKDFDADIDFDTNNKSFNALSATIETNSIDTGMQKRDAHLKNADFFDAEKFPNITFIMTSYNNNTLVGKLTMHGETKEISLKSTVHGVVKDSQGNTRMGFTLEGQLNRKDFGLTWNKIIEGGGLTVGEDVNLVIDIEAIQM